MTTYNLSQLRERARQRADMENSRFISDSELNSFINASYGELYDLLVATRGENYYITSHSFTTTSGVDTYALPNDFFKLMGVDYVTSPNQAITLRPFMWQERNRFKEPFYNNANYNLMYQIRGNNLVFVPAPNGNQSIKLWYIPRAIELNDDSDSFDGINGWEEYVIIDAAIKMRIKEETSIDELVLAKSEMKARISQASAGRDSSEPLRVTDVDRGYVGVNKIWS
jgi:hypothetical protein